MLGEGSWRLVAMGAPAAALDPEISITLQVDRQTGAFSGVSGCNRYTAPFAESGDGLSLGPLSLTKKHCPEPAGVMALESRFVAALQSAEGYTETAGGLILHCGKAGTLEFAPLDGAAAAKR